MREAIKISKLTKSYGTHVVLNGLEFCVQRGEIFALLGVNGAGKTTSLECIEGLRKYDSGSITINGIMGIQLQSASLPEHMKPLESVRLFAKWNKTPLDKETLDALGINEFAKKQYYQLSTGQKRRLHLALALTRNPDILFLDEPTAGLDVEGRLSLHEQIRQLKAIGKTIILSSHDITIQTENGMEKYKFENIGESLLTLLMEYKEKGETIVDIQIDRGSLEQHFIKIAKGA